MSGRRGSIVNGVAGFLAAFSIGAVISGLLFGWQGLQNFDLRSLLGFLGLGAVFWLIVLVWRHVHSGPSRPK